MKKVKLMEIRWLGHSAFELISDEGVKILVDPFISNNPSCPLPVEEIEAEKLISDALALEEVGCFAIVLEKIPASLAEKVAKKVKTLRFL